MANKKITELPESIVAGQNDVLPIVDVAGPETKKIKFSNLKSSLSLNRSDVGLSNVDNTSDANKPISTATQAALDLKSNEADLQAHIADLANPHQVTKSQVGLDQVNNTSDINKPISSATQTALDLKADAASVYSKTESDNNFEPKNANIQAHIADLSNPHQVTKAQVGLGNVDDTSDADKPISTATQTALNLKEDAANKGATNGYAPLVDGLVPAVYLPSYVDQVVEVANYAALPNPGEVSVIYITLDDHKTYRWSGSTYVEVSPSDVSSVNGHTGIVVLTKSDIGLSNVDNTSDADKPISTATQTALNTKQDSLGFTPENVANKSTSTSLGTSNTLYPTQNAVKSYVDSQDALKVSKSGDTMTGKLILQDGLTTLNTISGFDSSGQETVTIAPEYAEFILRKENFQTSVTPNYALFTEIDTEGSGSWKGITFIEKSSIYLYDENNNPSLPVDPAQVTTKAYVDNAIAVIPPVDLSGYYTKSEVDSKDSVLDGKISTEKGRIDAILSASQADKDTFAEIVTLINSVDTANDQAFAGYVLSNDAALAQEVLDRQSGDSSTLSSANSYTDAQIAAIPPKVSKSGDTMTGELILQDGLSTLNTISGFDSNGEHTLTIAPEYAEFILRKENFQTSITANYALFTEIDTEGSGSWKGITFIEKSHIYLYDENNNPSLPVDGGEVTTKAYVDELVANSATRLQGAAPTASNDPGVPGDIRFDSNNLYVCIAVNTWKKVGLSNF